MQSEEKIYEASLNAWFEESQTIIAGNNMEIEWLKQQIEMNKKRIVQIKNQNKFQIKLQNAVRLRNEILNKNRKS